VEAFVGRSGFLFPFRHSFFLSPALFEDQGSGRVALLIFYHTRFQQRWSFRLSATVNSTAARVMLTQTHFHQMVPSPDPRRVCHRESNVGLRILLIWRVILPRKIRARLTNILEAIVGVLKVFFGYVRDLHEIAKKPNFERMGSMNRNHDALGPSIFEVDVVTTLDS
jgi:hypothetical protein